MKNFVQLTIFGLVLFGCVACYPNKKMKERFPNGEYKILIDEQGRRYYVTWEFDDKYSIVPEEDFISK